MNNKKNRILIGSVFFSVLICIILLYKTRVDQDLKRNGIVVNAKILEVLKPPKGMAYRNFRCEFEFGGEIKSEISPSSIHTNSSYYVGKIYPALYSQRTNTLRILITIDDYAELGLEYPDSLFRK